MRIVATMILLSAHPVGAMDFQNNISIVLFEVHLSMMACKSRAIHLQHDMCNIIFDLVVDATTRTYL